jgi:hypothetical protein
MKMFYIIHKLWHPIVDDIFIIFAIDDVVHMWLDNNCRFVQFEL